MPGEDVAGAVHEREGEAGAFGVERGGEGERGVMELGEAEVPVEGEAEGVPGLDGFDRAEQWKLRLAAPKRGELLDVGEAVLAVGVPEHQDERAIGRQVLGGDDGRAVSEGGVDGRQQRGQSGVGPRRGGGEQQQQRAEVASHRPSHTVRAQRECSTGAGGREGNPGGRIDIASGRAYIECIGETGGDQVSTGIRKAAAACRGLLGSAPLSRSRKHNCQR